MTEHMAARQEWSLAIDLLGNEPLVLERGVCRVGLCIKVLSFDQAYKKGALSEHIPERATELITMILAALEEREHFYL